MEEGGNCQLILSFQVSYRELQQGIKENLNQIYNFDY